MTGKKILIIGAGIHGTFIAKYLKKYNVKIILIEKNSKILFETSRATHNRANRGYHYPRSLKTFNECRSAYKYFEKNYYHYLKKIPSFYCIENKSRLNFNNYKNFFIKNSLRFKVIKNSKFIKKDHIEGILQAEEGCFDHFGLCKMLTNKLRDKKIKVIKNFNLSKVKKIKTGLKLIGKNKRVIIDNFDLIINTTYDKSNDILQKFKLRNLPKYLYQLTEVVVVSSKKKIPGVTVMDGEFITIMPYIKKKIYI